MSHLHWVVRWTVTPKDKDEVNRREVYEDFLFIIDRENERYRENLHMSVGVMKDQKIKLRDLHVSHTLGCVGNWNT
jgi:hypothetical protein